MNSLFDTIVQNLELEHLSDDKFIEFVGRLQKNGCMLALATEAPPPEWPKSIIAECERRRKLREADYE